MGTALVPLDHYAVHRRVWRRLVQTARLCCGVGGHPHTTPPTRGGPPPRALKV